MIEIEINGVNTTRDENELYREFVETNDYNFCKFSQDLEISIKAIRDWLKTKKYVFTPDDKFIVEHIAFKI